MDETYIAVRCHGLVTHLLPRDVLGALASAKGLQDLTSILTPTDYGHRIVGLEKVDAQALEEAFNQVLAERFRYVVKLAPENLEGFMEAYARRLEVRNLSRLLRGKYSAASPGEIGAWLTPLSGLSRLNWDALLEAESLERAVGLLKGTFYEGLGGYVEPCSAYGSILPMEYALKRMYYMSVLDHAERLPSESREAILPLIGLEVDLANVSASLAPLVYGYSEDLTVQLLIPYHHRVSGSKLVEAVRAKSSQAALDALTPYNRVVEQILAGRDDLAEAEGLKILREEAEHAMRGSPIELPYTLGYLILCELECRDLSFIAVAVEHGVSPGGYLSV
ncbi:MAG: V-type ATPase subunit [Candidatus Bathyarchaeia archaeon]